MSMRSLLLLYLKTFPEPTASSPHIQTPPQIQPCTRKKKKKLCFSWICDVFNKPKCELDYDSAQRDLSWDIYYTKGIDQKPKKT